MPAFSTCAQAAPLRFRRRLPLISALWLDVTPRKARGVRLTARTVRRWPSPKTYIRATKSGGGADGVPSSNVTDLKGIAEIDVLIDRLLLAEASARLELVRENILAFDAAFFLRLAARSDTALEDHTRDAMVRLAEQVMTLLDGVVREAERRSDASGDVLTTIVAAAAQDDGQFLVPLSAKSVSRMRAAVVKASTSGALDEGVVANAYAWIRKASEDGLDGMVVILQRVLQLYAQSALPAEGGSPIAQLIDKVVASDEEQWDALLREGLHGLGEQQAMDADSFFKCLQSRMEKTVLDAGAGTFSQRVQAEYLKEIEDRASAVLKEKGQ